MAMPDEGGGSAPEAEVCAAAGSSQAPVAGKYIQRSAERVTADADVATSPPKRTRHSKGSAAPLVQLDR